MNTYKTTIGIEVHIELTTKSKMFCGCANNPHDTEPNKNTCPVCLAHPGTLPVVNEEAVLSILKMGTAIEGTLFEYSEFDRKNYFYPDIPKAYQISQYKFPFVEGGVISGVAITRIHLEEDTARSVHDQGGESLVDYNRAGVPLMELVTEPVIHTKEEAVRFAKELQLLVRTLGISDAHMEKGEMRVEANISVSKTDTFGTKVEVKNLNSFKSVEQAIAYEVARHIETLESGGTIEQETRGWDEQKGKTFLQRKKETAQDYRYFPDPDIPKYMRSEVEKFSDSRISEITPRNLAQTREHFSKIGLNENLIESVIANPDIKNLIESALEQKSEIDPVLLANYVVNDLGSIVSSGAYSFRDVNALCFANLIGLVQKGELNSRVAKDLLVEVAFMGNDPLSLAAERGLLQQNDTSALLLIIDKVIAENHTVALEFKAGKQASLQYLIGQCMKLSKGSANPAVLKDLLVEKLSA
jgi:aspartyl-tRNA(Asn)/glutamyl-tRNA(Gln) amidotransferase subunit B